LKKILIGKIQRGRPTMDKCIKCNKTGELTYQSLPTKWYKQGFDYSCGWCGEWQLEESDNER